MNWGDLRDRFWWAFPPYLILPEWVTVPWYELTHLPTWISWTPPWRRHKPACDDRFRVASQELLEHPEAEGAGEVFKAHTAGITYCATCDYIEATPSRNRVWYWCAHIETVIDAFLDQWKRRHRTGY